MGVEGGRDPFGPASPGHRLLGWVLARWTPIATFPTTGPHPSGLLGLSSCEAGQLCPGLSTSLSCWAASVCPICGMGWPDVKELSEPQAPGLCDSGILKRPFPSTSPVPVAQPAWPKPPTSHPPCPLHRLSRPLWDQRGLTGLPERASKWAPCCPGTAFPQKLGETDPPSGPDTGFPAETGQALPLSVSQFSFLTCALGTLIDSPPRRCCEDQI